MPETHYCPVCKGHGYVPPPGKCPNPKCPFNPPKPEDGFERRSRLIAEGLDIQERRHGRVR